MQGSYYRTVCTMFKTSKVTNRSIVVFVRVSTFFFRPTTYSCKPAFTETSRIIIVGSYLFSGEFIEIGRIIDNEHEESQHVQGE